MTHRKYKEYVATLQTAFSIFAGLGYERDLHIVHERIQNPAELYKVYKEMKKKFSKTDCQDPDLMAKIMLAFPFMNEITNDPDLIMDAIISVESTINAYRTVRAIHASAWLAGILVLSVVSYILCSIHSVLYYSATFVAFCYILLYRFKEKNKTAIDEITILLCLYFIVFILIFKLR